MYFGRGKNKKQNPYTFADMYKDYIKDKPEGSPYHVSYIVYVKICSDYFKEFREGILQGKTMRHKITLGEWFARKKKVILEKAALNPDWLNTVKYGKKIFHLNEHSGGYSYKIMWRPAPSNLAFIYCYAFTACREFKRMFAKYIKSGNYDYFEKT